MNIRFLLFLGVILASAVFAGQVEKTAEGKSPEVLQEYLQAAALNNAALKAKFEGWKAAMEVIPQAGALDDPKFTYSYFIEEVETRVGPQRNKFQLMQQFPWFGEIEARTDAAGAKAKAARERYEAAKLELFEKVKRGFYEYAYLATAIKIAKDNLELLEHFEEVARIKYKTATAMHPDVIRAQIEMIRMDDVVKSLEKLREPQVAQLNALLNRDIKAQLPWPVGGEFAALELKRDELIDILVESNPKLKELDWELKAARSMIEVAKTNYYPDFGVGVDWIQTGEAINSSMDDSGKDAVALIFSLNIPLGGGKYTAKERQARAVMRQVREQRVDSENRLIAGAIKALYEIEDSERKIRLYRESFIPKAEELVQASEAAYMSGMVDFLSLLDSQRMLLKYSLELERTVTNYYQKVAELSALVGRDLN